MSKCKNCNCEDDNRKLGKKISFGEPKSPIDETLGKMIDEAYEESLAPSDSEQDRGWEFSYEDNSGCEYDVLSSGGAGANAGASGGSKRKRTPGVKRYYELRRILSQAGNQAERGKGNRQHDHGEMFEDQQICQINRWLQNSPVAGCLFQVVKKALETTRKDPRAAIKELRGVICYAAAAILLYEEIAEETERKGY